MKTTATTIHTLARDLAIAVLAHLVAMGLVHLALIVIEAIAR